TSPTITWKDTAAGTTTTARLSKTWFVTQVNGVDVAQRLGITYTDWNGKQQNAWLAGNPTNGYVFLTFSAPTNPNTSADAPACLASDICGYGTSINYIGADGQQYSASVRGYVPPPISTGAPIYPASTVEGTSATFNANDFKPINAAEPISYK